MSLVLRNYTLNGVNYNVYIHINDKGRVHFRQCIVKLLLAIDSRPVVDIDTEHMAVWYVLNTEDRNKTDWSRHTIFVHDCGLYEWMQRSNNPQMAVFRRWIDNELASLRKSSQWPMIVTRGV